MTPVTTNKIRVLCVDDSAEIADLYAVVIGREPDMEHLGSLFSADGLSEEVLNVKPGVVLLDLTMPGTPPLEAVRQLAAIAPETRVIAFSGHDDADTVEAALNAGAWGLVSKHEDVDAVLAAIRRVAAGGVSIPGGN